MSSSRLYEGRNTDKRQHKVREKTKEKRSLETLIYNHTETEIERVETLINDNTKTEIVGRERHVCLSLSQCMMNVSAECVVYQ